MAHVVSVGEKRTTGIPCHETITINEDSPSSSKKLKQARLPFKPLDLKSQLTANPVPSGVPKKRKLSDQESPSAKAQKTVTKHQLERFKHDDKTHETSGHDNEVSSSSEAENLAISVIHKRKSCETNILERYVRKSSQEEISSTNEVVDLVSDVEDLIEISAEDSEDSEEDTVEKPGSKDSDKEMVNNKVAKGDKLGGKDSDTDIAKENVAMGDKPEGRVSDVDNVKENLAKDNNGKQNIANDYKLGIKDSDVDTVNEKGNKLENRFTLLENCVLSDKHKHVSNDNQTNAVEIAEDIKHNCVDTDVKLVDLKSNLNASITPIACDDHIDIKRNEIPAVTDRNVDPINASIVDSETTHASSIIKIKTQTVKPVLSSVLVEESVSLADKEPSGVLEESACLNLSASTGKSERDDESSLSCDDKSGDDDDKSGDGDDDKSDDDNDKSGDDNNTSVGDISICGTEGIVESLPISASPLQPGLCSTPVSKPHGKMENKKDTASSPNSSRTRPRSLKMSEVQSAEKKQVRGERRLKIKEQKEQERLKKLEEKEKLKLDTKKKKDDEKAEKELKKKEEKEKKERERQDKKDLFEREKIEKQQNKDDKQKKKQEIIDAKLDEKKKKDDDRRLKEEDKLREENEKNKKNLKVKQNFSSFFIKKIQQQATKPKEESSKFMPFQLKKDMTLAPAFRHVLSDLRKTTLDQLMLEQENAVLYVEECKQPLYKAGKSLRTVDERSTQSQDDVPDDEVKFMDIDDDDDDDDDDVGVVEEPCTLERHPCKLLQFHTNHRPPYYGTWRKTSSTLKARNPFIQDSDLFDYEVDSDDEWEEEEPGESVSSSEDEGEDKEEEGEDEEEDGWMVPHGYLSEDEGCDMDEEVTPDVLKARQQAKLDAWEADQKKQKHRVRAIVIGCVWDGDNVMGKMADVLNAFQAVCLSAVPIDFKTTSSDNTTSNGRDGEKNTGKGNIRPVPEEAMVDLIRLLHGNALGIKKLIREFRLYWKKKTSGSLDISETDMAVDESITEKCSTTLDESIVEDKTAGETADVSIASPENGKDSSDDCGISKRQLNLSIMAIAVREKRSNFKKVCWYVHEKVLQQYKIVDISFPNAWQYVSKDLMKVKQDDVLGRQTPNALSESFSETVPLLARNEHSEEVDKLRTDQPCITKFARKMLPSELPKPKIHRRIELKPVTHTTAAASLARIDLSESDLDTSAHEEVLAPYKVLPKDQRSILDFAKKTIKKPATSISNIKSVKLQPPSGASISNVKDVGPSKTTSPSDATVLNIKSVKDIIANKTPLQSEVSTTHIKHVSADLPSKTSAQTVGINCGGTILKPVASSTILKKPSLVQISSEGKCDTLKQQSDAGLSSDKVEPMNVDDSNDCVIIDIDNDCVIIN